MKHARSYEVFPVASRQKPPFDSRHDPSRTRRRDSIVDCSLPNLFPSKFPLKYRWNLPLLPPLPRTLALWTKPAWESLLVVHRETRESVDFVMRCFSSGSKRSPHWRISYESFLGRAAGISFLFLFLAQVSRNNHPFWSFETDSTSRLVTSFMGTALGRTINRNKLPVCAIKKWGREEDGRRRRGWTVCEFGQSWG